MKTRITELLGTTFPLLLGPMRLMTLGEMAAAVSNSGGFGQIAASGATGELLRAEIEKATELTDRPIGVNIPIYRPNAFEALDIAIEMGLRAVTTSAGNPLKMMERIRDAGLKVLHKVSTVEMALKAQDAGVDGVIATGYEAGGHVGREETTTLILVPQLVEALEIPVVAAGGIGDARGLVAAFAIGAEGVELGTRFVATHQCPAPDYFKRSIIESRGNATVLLGKGQMPIRVLRNKRAQEISDPDKSREDKEITSGGDRWYAQEGGDADTAIMPAGQVAALIKDIENVSEVIPKMIQEATKLSHEIHFLFEGAGR